MESNSTNDANMRIMGKWTRSGRLRFGNISFLGKGTAITWEQWAMEKESTAISILRMLSGYSPNSCQFVFPFSPSFPRTLVSLSFVSRKAFRCRPVVSLGLMDYRLGFLVYLAIKFYPCNNTTSCFRLQWDRNNLRPEQINI